MQNAACTDTIFALATPPGRGGVAVVRVSGAGAHKSAAVIAGAKPLTPRMTSLRLLRDPQQGAVIDHAMVIGFSGPASFTGEDVVEYHLHGGPAVVRAMLDALKNQPGHRMAEPGEFTRRAFENGKMDLTAAEAIADLIHAETQLQAQQALRQMDGALSTLYEGWRDQLKRALAHLEADLDFPDEDLPDGVAEQVTPVILDLIEDVQAHLNDNRRGERLRDGIHIAVIGAPNAGKSSLVNALAKRDVAIVSDQAGTTRDVIEVHLDLNGYPVILADTAGLRPDQIGTEGADAIEGEGIRRALQRAESADIRMLVFDATDDTLDRHTLNLVDETCIIVANKADAQSARSIDVTGYTAIDVSARTGQGMDGLINAMIERLDQVVGRREAPSLTRARHRDALDQCHDHLTRALSAPLPELMAEDVRLALRALGRITGRVDVEDLLDVIFRDFCIGK